MGRADPLQYIAYHESDATHAPSSPPQMFSHPQCLAIVALMFCCAVRPGRGAEPAPRGLAQEITVHGQSLEGNLDSDTPNRKVSVYLPPSYSRDLKRRYPVVYMLHGFAENNEKWFGSEQKWINLPEMLDRSIANGTVPELIVIVPDA